MKLSWFTLLILFHCTNCSSQIKTDESSVKRVITTTQYLLLNHDFNKLDTVRHQKEVNKFDSNNNLLEEMDYYGASEIFGGGVIYKYDKRNRKTEEYLLDIHNQLTSKYSFENLTDSSIEFAIKSTNAKIKWKTNYYDSSGQLIREISYYPDGSIMSDFYFKYNSFNQQIEKGGTLDAKKMPTFFKSYDSSGNLIEKKSLDPDGVVLSVEVFTYTKFDERRNWEIRRSTVNGQPHSVTFQKIEIK
jgi:hypothetical protein